MDRTLLLIAVSLIAASAASASLTVYLDDQGPASDTVLSVSVLLEAVAIDPEVSSSFSNEVKLFSEYDGSDDPILAISRGEAWIVTQRETELIRTLSRALDNRRVPYSIVQDAPEALTGWERAISEANADEVSEPVESRCDPIEETVSYCDDGSIEEACTCVGGALVCEMRGCPAQQYREPVEELVQGSEEPVEDERERRGVFERIADFLFGWLRRTT
jgi:hypothetical protein